jgi:hypothetical protein
VAARPVESAPRLTLRRIVGVDIAIPRRDSNGMGPPSQTAADRDAPGFEEARTVAVGTNHAGSLSNANARLARVGKTHEQQAQALVSVGLAIAPPPAMTLSLTTGSTQAQGSTVSPVDFTVNDPPAYF